MATSSDDRLLTGVAAWKEYRPGKSVLIGSIVTAILAASMTAGVLLIALWNATTRMEWVFCLLIAGWMLCMMLLCILSAAYYFRGRLYLSEEATRSVGWFHTRTTPLAEVTQAKWRYPDANGGWIVLQALSGKHVIDFSPYTASQRAELIEFFRRKLPEAVQVDWPDFESGCKLGWSNFDGSWNWLATSRVGRKWLVVHAVVFYFFFTAGGLFFLISGALLR